jgi:hypothetical protein
VRNELTLAITYLRAWCSVGKHAMQREAEGETNTKPAPQCVAKQSVL